MSSEPAIPNTNATRAVMPTKVDMSAGAVNVPDIVIVDPIPRKYKTKQEKTAAKREYAKKRMDKLRGIVAEPEVSKVGDVVSKSRAWSGLRSTSLYELARVNCDNHTLASGIEFLRSIWQDGIMIGHRVGADNKVTKIVQEIQDPRLRVEAFEKWANRLFGQPVAQIEVEKNDDSAVRFVQVNIERLQAVAVQRNEVLEALRSKGDPGGPGAAHAPAPLPR